MPKRDISKLSDSRQPRTLFLKQRKRLLVSPWFLLVLVIVVAVALNYLGLVDIWGLFRSSLG